MSGKRTTKLCVKFERSQRSNSSSGGLRKLPDVRNWYVAEELDGEVNIFRPCPSGLHTRLFFQLLNMNGELLFEICWKINRTENPPCVAHELGCYRGNSRGLTGGGWSSPLSPVAERTSLIAPILES